EAEMARVDVNGLFLRGERVEEQRGEPCFAQRLGHEPIAGAVPTAATAVGEEHNTSPLGGDVKISFQGHASRRYADGLLFASVRRPFHEPLPSTFSYCSTWYRRKSRNFHATSDGQG